MTDYEVIIERMNPCGGSQHGKKEIIEISTDDPAAYVRQHSQYPILEVNQTGDEAYVITTGDGRGYITKYFFSV